MKYAEEMAIAFNMYCDDNRLSAEQGDALAEEIGEALAAAADDRRNYLPPDLLDSTQPPEGGR